MTPWVQLCCCFKATGLFVKTRLETFTRQDAVTQLNISHESAFFGCNANTPVGLWSPSENKLRACLRVYGQIGDVISFFSLSEHEAMTPLFPDEAVAWAWGRQSWERAEQGSMRNHELQGDPHITKSASKHPQAAGVPTLSTRGSGVFSTSSTHHNLPPTSLGWRDWRLWSRLGHKSERVCQLFMNCTDRSSR